MSTFEIAILVMIGILLLLVVYLIVRVTVYISYDRGGEDRMSELIMSLRDRIGESNEKSSREINSAMMRGFASIQESSRAGMNDVNAAMREVNSAMRQGLEGVQTAMDKSLGEIRGTTDQKLAEISGTMDKDLTLVRETMDKNLADIRDTTDRNLTAMQANINDKLDKSLNERLDSSFRQVGNQLEALYKSLGELQNLESGVASLNRTLANVKTRGIYGEAQLRNLLANIMDKSQYGENVATVPGSAQRVEFAVKIPDKDSGGFIWLPIDSKYPADIYNKIMEAAEAADADALKAAQKELKDRIRSEARDISSKYVSPPDTTDFAIMFLPTEGLYSEVLRLGDLVERIQAENKIVIAGPSTLAALLNSLSIGFRYLTVNKKSEQILKLLGDFRTQFAKFDQLIVQTQKRIADAQEKTDALARRSGMIQKKLQKVEQLGYEGPAICDSGAEITHDGDDAFEEVEIADISEDI
jgi:DNA recombination protein RmuC